MQNSNDLDELFNMCLNNDVQNQEKMSKQFDETFTYRGRLDENNLSLVKFQGKRRNTVCGPIRRFSFPKQAAPYKRTACKQRRGTVLEDSIDEFLQNRRNTMTRNGSFCALARNQTRARF